MKNTICIITGILGTAVAALFGGWDGALYVLGFLMIIDYVTGLVVAAVFHKSPKSANGGLESHAGLKGLARKVGILAMVAAAHLVDRMFGSNVFRDGVAIAFCANEVISIVENAGLMGLPIPKFVTKMIDVLRSKAGETEAGPSTVETTGKGEDGFLRSLRSVEMTEGQEGRISPLAALGRNDRGKETAEAKKKPPDEGDRETEPAAPRNDTEKTRGEIGGQIARATENDGASRTPPHTEEEDGKC